LDDRGNDGRIGRYRHALRVEWLRQVRGERHERLRFSPDRGERQDSRSIARRHQKNSLAVRTPSERKSGVTQASQLYGGRPVEIPDVHLVRVEQPPPRRERDGLAVG